MFDSFVEQGFEIHRLERLKRRNEKLDLTEAGRPSVDTVAPVVSAPRFLRPRRGRKLTAQGHARSIFRRAIERRNLLVAEATARELGKVTLDEALDLVCLVCERDATRFDAFAVRWVARVTAERRLTLAELDLAVAALRALPSERAEATLRRFAA